MHRIPSYDDHPSPCESRWPVSLKKVVDQVQVVTTVIDLIRDHSIASSGVHVVPEGSHQVASADGTGFRERLV